MVTVVTQIQAPTVVTSSLRRSSIARCGAIEPSSPTSKKHVAFADERGFELVTVKLLQSDSNCISGSNANDENSDVMPPISNHSAAVVIQTLSILAKRRQQWQSTNNHSNGRCQVEPHMMATSSTNQWSVTVGTSRGTVPLRTNNHRTPPTPVAPAAPKTWEFDFCQPVYDYENFTRKLAERKVSLENVCMSDDWSTVSGFVKVRNLAYEKNVFVRYSTDNWNSYRDVSAKYVLGVAGDAFDTFKFEFNILHSSCYSSVRNPSRVEFCVCYKPGAQNAPLAEHWDNNGGQNYAILAKPPRPATVPASSSTTSTPTLPGTVDDGTTRLRRIRIQGQDTFSLRPRIHQLSDHQPAASSSCGRQSAVSSNSWDAFAAWKHYQAVTAATSW